MQNRKFKRAATFNRFKAIVVTVGFHIVLLALISGNMEGSIIDFMPDFLKELVGMDSTTAVVEEPRP